jgi:hypothetical protein
MLLRQFVLASRRGLASSTASPALIKRNFTPQELGEMAMIGVLAEDKVSSLLWCFDVS